MPVSELEAGDCVRDAIDEATPVVVRCEEPHALEIYLADDLDSPGGSTFPTGEVISAAAEARCDEALALMGGSVDSAMLPVLSISPTAEQWRAGNRHLVCAVSDPGGSRTTGTLISSG